MTKTKASPTGRRTHAERRAETRTRLLNAARELFMEKPFSETATPEIVQKAGVTRGALYHHFEDKTDLFRAIAELEAQAVGLAIDQATQGIADPDKAILVGTNAYFESMAIPGRAKVLLVDAPVILGHEEALALTKPQGSNQLKDGLSKAMPELSATELDALTQVMSAAFDRAALEIAQGADQQSYVKALFLLIGRTASAVSSN